MGPGMLSFSTRLISLRVNWVPSAEGRVFRVEKDEVPQTNWIWHMDGLMRIMADSEYTEPYLDAADDWKPVLENNHENCLLRLNPPKESTESRASAFLS